MSKLFSNDLRSERQRAGFRQEDIAWLLGTRRHSKVSRHEKRRRLPPLTTALAYEAIYAVPVATLFAGVYREIELNVYERARHLVRKADDGIPKAQRERRQRSLGALVKNS